MGVKWLVPYREHADVQAVAELKERMKRLRGRKLGRWHLTCTLYLHATMASHAPSPADGTEAAKELYLLKEEGASTGFEGEGKCCLMAQSTVIEAGADMEQIMEKIKIYNPRQTVTGMQYAIGDFVVKVGSIMLGESTRGVLLEVEYRPCMIPNGCTQILQNFIANLGPFSSTMPLSPVVNFAGVSLPPLYSPQHTTLQYVRLFQALKYFKQT